MSDADLQRSLAALSPSDRAKYDFAMERYDAALHGVQTGIRSQQEFEQRPLAVALKHMRVGVDSAHVSNHAVSTLLIRKGIIDLVEYVEQLADSMEAEKLKYEAICSKMYGRPVSLI